MNAKTKNYESQEEIKDINVANTSLSLYLINNKKFVAAFSDVETLNFYDIKNEKINLLSSLKNISCSYGRKICTLINDNILIVGGINQKGFYLINLKKFEVIGIINDYNINRVHSIIKLKNGNILVGLADEKWDCNIYELKFENNKFLKIRELERCIHDGEIYGICEIKENRICSGGYYGDVKIYK